MTPLQALDHKIITALKVAIGGHREKSARDARLNLSVRNQRTATEKANATNDELSRIALPGMKLGEVLALGGWEFGFQNVAGRLVPVRIVFAEEIADRISSRIDETKAVEEAAAASQEEDPAHLFEPRPDPQAPTPPAAPKMHPADSPEPFTPHELRALRKFLHYSFQAELSGHGIPFLSIREAQTLDRFLKHQANAKPNNVA